MWPLTRLRPSIPPTITKGFRKHGRLRGLHRLRSVATRASRSLTSIFPSPALSVARLPPHEWRTYPKCRPQSLALSVTTRTSRNQMSRLQLKSYPLLLPPPSPRRHSGLSRPLMMRSLPPPDLAAVDPRRLSSSTCGLRRALIPKRAYRRSLIGSLTFLLGRFAEALARLSGTRLQALFRWTSLRLPSLEKSTTSTCM